MKLYDLKTGTNTRRVRIFLAEKGVKPPTALPGAASFRHDAD
jgi:hypothetical protein